MRLPLAAVLAILIAGTLAPSAGAATVSVERSDQTVYVNVVGGPESDVLTVSSPAPGHFTVTQAPGLPLMKVGNQCSVAGRGRIDCTAQAAGALVVGGDGDDRLEISGAVGYGAWLYGNAGADTLTGGLGADRLDGGAGVDILHAADGRKDELLCGTEFDGYDADAVDMVAADCERRLDAPATPPVTSPDPGPAPTPPPAPAPLPPAPAPVEVASSSVTLRNGAVALRVSCAAAQTCRGWITIRMLPRRSARNAAAAARRSARSRRPVIARQRYRVAPGATKTITAHISRRGRQRVLDRRRARCSVRISSVAPDGTTQTTTTRITIKAGGGR